MITKSRNNKNFGIRKFRAFAILLTTMFISITMDAQTISTKVYGKTGENKYYGKLYIPKGGKWRIARTPKTNVMVTVYSSFLDGQDIYLYPVPQLIGYYWIDATETDQILMVRSKDGNDDVIAEKITDELDTEFLADGYYYFDASDKKKNRFQYATTTITNKVLRETKTYNTRDIYVMANPAKNGLAFAKLDAEGTTRNLAQGSLYVLAKKGSGTRLNVIIEEDEEGTENGNLTGIRSVETLSPDDDAIYTLQGVRVVSPKKGSLYIRNGRKFIAK